MKNQITVLTIGIGEETITDPEIIFEMMIDEVSHIDADIICTDGDVDYKNEQYEITVEFTNSVALLRLCKFLANCDYVLDQLALDTEKQTLKIYLPF